MQLTSQDKGSGFERASSLGLFCACSPGALYGFPVGAPVFS